MVKPKGDKQVEYLDLDLDSGKSTPPRKVRSCSAPAFLPSEDPEPFFMSSCQARASLVQGHLNQCVRWAMPESTLGLSGGPVPVLCRFGMSAQQIN